MRISTFDTNECLFILHQAIINVTRANPTDKSFSLLSSEMKAVTDCELDKRKTFLLLAMCLDIVFVSYALRRIFLLS